MNSKLTPWLRIASFFVASLLLLPPVSPAAALEPVKIGIVLFLSGASAGSYGIPARNAAELIVEKINGGSMPAPYDNKGIAGVPILPVYVDEASKHIVDDYRKLVQQDKVDLVIGYISSASCKTIAPVAEKLKRLTVLFDCGTPQIFEDIVTNPHYLFRTTAHATMGNVAAARYLLDLDPSISTISGINQNYAWGLDSWRDFKASLMSLQAGVKVGMEFFPELYAGEYGAEISSLIAQSSDVTHSSFWGGDLESFVLQAVEQGLFKKSKVVLTIGESSMYRLGERLPDGTVLGGNGTHGIFAPDSELNRWFKNAYYDRFSTWPTSPSYAMAQALLGVKAAYEKASSGATMPNQDKVAAALKGLEWESPSGIVKMAIANGHQAIQNAALGLYKYDREAGATIVRVKYYKAECVNPPAGMKGLEWIQSGFKDAVCD